MIITDNYVGIPFEDGGRTMDGADCWGLVMMLYRDFFEIELKEYYVSALDTEKVVGVMEEESKTGEWIRVETPEFGDLVAMSLHPRFRDHINHVGFYVGRGRFLHTIKETGSLIQRGNDLGSPKMHGIYRWVGE